MISPIYFLFILPPVLRAKYDCYMIEVQKTPVVYKVSNSLTVVWMLLSIILIHVVTHDPLWKITFLTFTTHWLVFDYLLNHYRGEPVLSYYGDFEDEVNLSFIEEYVYKDASWRALLLAKVNLFIISILIYIQ